jgi:UDP-N-acetylmuramate dehydrogenase
VIDHRSVIEDVPLAPMTTYKVGGNARWFAEPDGLEDLRSVLDATPPDVDVFLLGRGSNVVVSDEGVDGLVVRLGAGFSAIDVASDGSVVAGAGVALPVLARTAGRAGRSGLEFYVGIPGSVGGAVRMNAGGHGSDTASVLKGAVVLNMETRMVDTKAADALGFAYRHSDLMATEIVVQATFVTEPGDPEVIDAELRSITRWRKEHQPGGTLNAGSVFKNPKDEPAGAIIDRLGLKGTSVGSVRVSDVHANFLVATKESTASDIFAFVHEIQDIVSARTGLVLEPEVVFIGEFGGTT